MSWESWSLFVVTETLLCLTPGPAVLLVLAQALSRGGAKSLWSSLGILTANLGYYALSATSLGAILVASYDLFFAVKWLGAAYLVWLGLAALRGRSSVLAVAPAEDRGSRGGRMFVNGLVLQAANPKALLFFTALLPQFVDLAQPVAVQFAILAATGTAIEFIVLAAYGLLAGRISAVATRPHFAAITNRISGTMLITAGLGMAAMRRQ